MDLPTFKENLHTYFLSFMHDSLMILSIFE